MATTSTIATARQALVDAIDTGVLADKVYYAWPGSVVGNTNEVVWVDRVQEGSWTQTIPNIKAGRKQRQESYTFEVVLLVSQPGGDSTTAKTTFERAVTLTGVVEGALADDVQLGSTAVQWMVLEGRDIDLVPSDTGWMCQVVMRITAEARLT